MSWDNIVTTDGENADDPGPKKGRSLEDRDVKEVAKDTE